MPRAGLIAELFGHEKGAFTGAAAAAAGLIEAAAGGTLFLDEIGELPLAAQARLLRFLQESEIRRVGATRSRRVDVRVVAATHRDLARMVADQTFRDDLYYRLRVIEIVLPPLRDRGEDILALARWLLGRAAVRLGRAGLELTEAAEAAIAAHHWPGNVRELDNVVTRLVALSDGGRLGLDELQRAAPAPTASSGSGPFRDRVDAFERELIAAALREAGDNRAAAARALGLSRVTLLDRMKRLGLG
jgi:DNA-binding NtrC family response regulator